MQRKKACTICLQRSALWASKREGECVELGEGGGVSYEKKRKKSCNALWACVKSAVCHRCPGVFQRACGITHCIENASFICSVPVCKILPDRAHWPWYLCVPFIYVLFPLPHSKCLPVKFNPMGFAVNNCALCEVNSMEPCVLWAECMIRCVYAHVHAPVKATLLAHVDLVWVENHKSSVESEYFYSRSWNVCPLFNW